MPHCRVALLCLSTAALAMTSGLAAQEAPIVQPGAPGQESRVVTAQEAARLTQTRHTAADIAFMQMMIEHHGQALQMAEMADRLSQNAEVRAIAAKIATTQKDEIAFMRGWLAERGASTAGASDALAHDGHAAHQRGDAHHGHAGHTMPGMLTSAQLQSLGQQRGPAFDRMFLQLMIEHHQGAITMVEDLLKQPGTAHDPALFDFTSEVVADQKAEIARMNTQLATFAADPRVGLAPGFRDAGEAAWNMTLMTSRPNPPGFFDPTNPTGLLPALGTGDPAAGDQAEREQRFASRSPLLFFGNTDMAFARDLLALGNYHGFYLYRLAADGVPTLASAVVCPGGQGDVSIVGNLLLMSVEQTRGRVDCGIEGVTQDVSPDRFRGLRIFDISDLSRPRQVGLVQTCRGSHTHSVVSLPTAQRPSIIVYNSGTAGVREEGELAGCVGGTPGDARTALFSIDVIEIPVANPAAARIIDSPRVFADEAGNISGLWQGGDHGAGTQTSRETNQCHDITVFPSRRIAAGACSGNGIVLDIADPMKPVRIDAVVDPGFAYWHSATFNNDGTKVLFTDEWGGGMQPRCQASDPVTWGANAIYDIVDGRLQRRGTFKLPAPQSELENCVAHNGSIVPVPGRDLMIQAWYQGGLSLFDFTDSDAPREIAFFDRGPIDAVQKPIAGYWSAYFHKGQIYATEILRGLDVLTLQPSEHLSANEIAAAALAQGEDAFNPQRQTPVTWPAAPVVALAYLDQLERSGGLDTARIASLRTMAERAQGGTPPGRAQVTRLQAETMASGAAGTPRSATDEARLTALFDVMLRLAG